MCYQLIIGISFELVIDIIFQLVIGICFKLLIDMVFNFKTNKCLLPINNWY